MYHEHIEQVHKVNDDERPTDVEPTKITLYEFRMGRDVMAINATLKHDGPTLASLEDVSCFHTIGDPAGRFRNFLSLLIKRRLPDIAPSLPSVPQASMANTGHAANVDQASAKRLKRVPSEAGRFCDLLISFADMGY